MKFLYFISQIIIASGALNKFLDRPWVVKFKLSKQEKMNGNEFDEWFII